MKEEEKAEREKKDLSDTSCLSSEAISDTDSENRYDGRRLAVKKRKSDKEHE